MTTLYKPVLIEAAEQAEALPWGTIAFDQARMHCTLQKETDDYWFGDRSLDNEEVAHFGYTALVPVEAEEEKVVAVEPGNPYAEANMDSDGNVWFGDGIFTADVTEKFNEWASKNQRTRLVTPWEDA